MNKLFYITIPLLIANITFGLDCPNPTDKCRYRGKRFLPSDPNAPECWSFSYDRWQCTYKVDGKCDKAYGQIDITECNVPPPPPTPECPKATDACKTGDILWKADSPNAPKCWTKNPSVQFGWICRGDSEDECDASKGEADLTNCNIKPPVPTPECPKATNKCKTGDVIWDANSPNAPKCWTKNPSVEFGWTCRGNSGDKCDASKGETDIKTCNIPPPAPTPKCPKATDFCRNGIGSWRANDPYSPKCWSKTSSGWRCQGDSDAKCDTSKGEVDLKACNIPPPTPECPKATDSCLVGDIAYRADDPSAPKCWSKSSASQFGWSCYGSRFTTCDALRGEVDLGTCGITPPVPTPECPKATDSCLVVPPTPDCPKEKDYCRNGYSYFYASDLKAPACWRKTKLGWTCNWKKGYTCDKGEVDLTVCFPYRRRKCPKKNYDSYSHYGSGYGSGYKPGYNTPKPGYGSGYKPSYGSGYNPVYNPVYKGH
ncbi:hypothetical protein K502DRAFT_342735 [Neoconidiobolus thromboides FSU 785]|nr:hypothetical protein K502DRAFT_342735 [Neoconidiobolus thromboides FSU 785]